MFLGAALFAGRLATVAFIVGVARAVDALCEDFCGDGFAVGAETFVAARALVASVAPVGLGFAFVELLFGAAVAVRAIGALVVLDTGAEVVPVAADVAVVAVFEQLLKRRRAKSAIAVARIIRRVPQLS